ncbi:MAG: hypothetical protein KC619_23595 [Myxococcales bacterium]|nr:hypothetical protein [Myxococcales bacterium]
MGTLRRLPLALMFGLVTACSAGGGSPLDGSMAGPDAGAGTDAGEPMTPECASDEDCGSGFVCAAVGGVPQCVPDPNPPPPGDGTDCGTCPAPGECRAGICVQPSATGAFCEFDPECGEGELCIAGRCTPDPRTPTPCTTDGDCYAGLTCGPDGFCICAFATDCPAGLICEEGACVPPPGSGTPCVADAECPADEVCDRGSCRDGMLCDIGHPDFSGTWTMQSVLRIREALPSWLDSFLTSVEEPLRFIAGDAACFDFGLPMWVETEICDLVRPLIEEYVPPWGRSLARAIADLNDVLNEWHVDETMHLTAGSVTDSYRGDHTWDRLTIYYRGMPLMGTPETIRDWRFSPSPFNASAVCGTFYIDRHDVNVSIGAIIAWAVDVLVWAITEGEHDSLGSALSAMSAGFCRALGDFADENVDYAGVGDRVFGICTSQVESLINRALRALIDARIGTSPITLRGEAPVTGPSSLRPGTWDGTLLGSGFTGDWSAMR